MSISHSHMNAAVCSALFLEILLFAWLCVDDMSSLCPSTLASIFALSSCSDLRRLTTIRCAGYILILALGAQWTMAQDIKCTDCRAGLMTDPAARGSGGCFHVSYSSVVLAPVEVQDMDIGASMAHLANNLPWWVVSRSRTLYMMEEALITVTKAALSARSVFDSCLAIEGGTMMVRHFA